MKITTNAYNAFRLALIIALGISSAACSTRLSDRRPIDTRTSDWSRDGQDSSALTPGFPSQAAPNTTPPERPDNSFFRPGSGELIAGQPQSIAQASNEGGDIKLNFENANLLEVVKVVLGDMLNVSYVVDPRVQGAVTMQTSNPLPRSALIPTLELLLRMNEAALVSDGPVYKILPLANAATGIRAPQLGDSSLPLPRGYSVRIVPVKYVSATEMAQILEPFVAAGTNLLRVDTQRNVIILAGSGEEMARLLETIRMFDVDRMKGMSVAMFTPDFVDAKTLGEELTQLLADAENGLMAGLVRFVTIDRLNGLMVVTPRPEYLSQVRTWVDRLDRDSGSAGRRLFIYRVQNGKATELAEVLNQLFESDQQAQTPPATLAPGLQPATAKSSTPPTQDAAAPQPPLALPAAGAGEGFAISNTSEVRIIADETNNALMILASAQEYRQILNAMKQLDVTPMQVLIDVTIAEVTLADDLRYGVEWFFRNAVTIGGARKTDGVGLLNLGNNLDQLAGFSYAIQTGSTVKFILNMLAQESNVSIISSPTLLVLNNQEASIQVGAEIPVTTQQQQPLEGTTNTTTNVLNSVEYRDTGILLNVKPRVNAGGLVIMEVDQESSQSPDADAGDNTPRIQTRKIKSTVAVQSGDTIMLGGLIQETRDQSESGIPGLHKTPILGALFGRKADNQDRTELLVLITPRAILDRNTALRVTEQFRRKLNSLIPVESAISPDQQPGQDGFTTGSGDASPRPEQPTRSGADGSASAETMPVAATPATAAVKPSGICERFGPFESTEARARVRSLLGDNIDTREQEAVAREAESYHVRIPPQPSTEVANNMVDRLRKAGMNDLLIYDVGPLKNAISIGVYKDRTAAELLLGKARSLDIPAEIQTLARSNEPRYWLITRRDETTMIPLSVKSSYETVDCSMMSLR